MEKHWATVAEIAVHLSLHPMTIRKMISRGELKACRIGRAVRVDVRRLDAMLEAQTGTVGGERQS